MSALEKINGLTVKVLHHHVEAIRPGTALETIYRWRAALTSGRGISDAHKRLLIAATASTAMPITVADFWADLPMAGATQVASREDLGTDATTMVGSAAE